MKRIALFLLLLLFMSNNNLLAQQKQFTLEDLIPGGTTYANFVPSTPLNYIWQGDELLSYDKNNLYSEKGKIILTLEELKTITNSESVSINRLSFVSFDEKTLLARVQTKDKLLFLDLKDKKIECAISLENTWANLDFCPKNRTLAFTKENNLYITDEQDSFLDVEIDAFKDIVFGQAVHRYEFGIEKGTFWSPKGNYLAFYRMDESMVADYPLVHIPTPKKPFGSEPVEAQLVSIKYPMAGQKSHEVTLGVYHLQSGEVIYLKTGEPKDHYLTNIAWDPSEKYIYIAELNREQNHMQYNKYDVTTGERVKTLFEERNERYVEPQHPALFLKNTPNQFIWQSQRDGFNHLYLYNTDGQLLKQLTSGNFVVNQILGFDKEEKNIYIQANAESPIEFHIYKVEIKTGKRTLLTSQQGVHKGQMNASGTCLVDYYASQETPLNIQKIDIKKNKTTLLQSALNPYEDYILPEISLGKLKADDNKTDLYYRIVKPTNFDPTKNYPAIIYVYGGPHNQSIVDSWMGAVRGWDIYMAQKGYIVLTLDNRGSDKRGFEFESIIHRQLSKHEVADQLKGLDYLFSLPYVDKDRIGVHGWSYGGFMTSNLMLRHGDIFKVGVAGGPVIDWSYYEVMYGERYMDTPQENPEGYEYTNMNNLAGELKGKFLLIHGDEDPTVVWQSSLSFLKACIQAGTYPDYFVYPGQGHNMIGRDRIHLHEKITQYFEENL